MITEKILENIQYYIGASYRRKLLDKILNENRYYFSGVVLDIGGGRKRGKFIPPETKKWIFADITPELKPDIICNVEKMQFEDESFDTIKATELFEHVEDPEQGINECCRVLKEDGYFIISMPFLYPIHGDPFDYQRWTGKKWNDVLLKNKFKIEKIEMIGYFFTVLAEMIKTLIKLSPALLRYLGYLSYPALDLLVKLDDLKIINKNNKLNKYTTGFFIIARK
ncbi:MAG: class I SAM-dependent methyltransferase [Parcubacteria group bacterium]